jgi:DNA replication protein DnaC
MGIDLTRRPSGLVPEIPTAPVCPTCNGAEFVRVGTNDPLDPTFGQTKPCPDCKEEALRTQRFERLLGQSGLEPFPDDTFASRWPMKAQQDAFGIARNWLDDPKGMLWFWGDPGGGKSMLSRCIGNKLLELQQPTIYREVPRLLREIRATFGKDATLSESDVWDAVMDVDCLILDEYGRVNPTPWVAEHLWELINHRWQYKLPTVVTTNKTIDELDDAIRSRVQDASVVTIVHVTATQRRTP